MGAWAGDAKNVTANYIGRNFAPLLTPKSEFLGSIGPSYQRLIIHFNSVVRDKNVPTVYHVAGYTQVKDNRCSFEGTITITKLMATGYEELGRGEDNKVDAVNARGTLFAEYDLRENPKEPHSGEFLGTMTMDWYIDTKNKLRFDDLDDVSDGYDNNRYKGTWASYGDPHKRKAANWGQYRIPDSGDLDTGAGEFWPNEKYDDFGWREYRQKLQREWSK
jgi:hypothetical protein